MTEVSIGYRDSPLNGSKPAGMRLPSVDGEAPYGAVDTLRFTIRASAAPLMQIPSPLLDPKIRPQGGGKGIEVVRPDGRASCHRG